MAALVVSAFVVGDSEETPVVAVVASGVGMRVGLIEGARVGALVVTTLG